jgi:hypothetical protein
MRVEKDWRGRDMREEKGWRERL